MTRHLITSALPYINGVKHLGNLVGSMLPADVYARFLRAAGEEVLFVCATDEHGTPAELAAHEAGQDVATYCAEQYEVQKDLSERFGLSWDWFGRTSRPQNHELTNHFARRLRAEGFCEIRTTAQVYSVADQRFLPDRYVVGTCPNCGYERARGDQCENCGKQLDPTDLIDPRSAVSGSTDLEVRDTCSCSVAARGPHPVWIDTRRTGRSSPGRSPTSGWTRDSGPRHHPGPRMGIPVGQSTSQSQARSGTSGSTPIGYLAATKEWANGDGQGATRRPTSSGGGGPTVARTT